MARRQQLEEETNGGPNRKSRLTSAARREQIVESARRLFLTLGPDGTSMQKIASDIGVNSALLYQHFTSMADIFEKVMLEPLEQDVLAGIAAGRERIAAHKDPRAAILELHVSLLSLMVDVGASLGVILFVDRFPGRQFYVDRIAPALTGWIEETLAENRLLLPSKTGPGTQVAGLLGIHLYLALDGYLRQDDFDIEEVAVHIDGIYSFGLFEKQR